MTTSTFPPPEPPRRRRVRVGDLPHGAWCHPPGNRPSGSYLRTTWVVCRRNSEGQVVLRLGRQVRLLDPGAVVLSADPVKP